MVMRKIIIREFREFCRDWWWAMVILFVMVIFSNVVYMIGTFSLPPMKGIGEVVAWVVGIALVGALAFFVERVVRAVKRERRK